MSMKPYYVRGDVHCYLLQSHPGYWFEVGRSETAQVLWGIIGDTLLIAHFDLTGDLVRVDRTGTASVLTGGLKDVMLHSSRRLRAELNLRDEPISIRRFWISDEEVGIEDVPEDLKEFLLAPDDFEEEEQLDLRESLDEWTTSGMFVFCWEQSFEVAASGVVETS